MIDYNSLSEILSGIFYDKKDFENFINLMDEEIPEYIRVNFLKIEKNKLIDILKIKGFDVRENEWVEEALEIRGGEFEVSKTIEHFLGFFYIQSLSSMLPVKFLDIGKEHKILDICAAPGSKTTQMGVMLENEGAILANDLNIERLRALSHNVDRIGLLNVMITRINGEVIGDLFFEEFDRVILDPPCSSLGAIFKDKSILKWWHPREIDRFYNIQKKLFESSLKALKPEGKMVYSTCTLSLKENEFLVSEMMRRYPLEIVDVDYKKIPLRKGIRKYGDIELPEYIEKTLRVYPQDIKSEGFYIAVIYKRDGFKRNERIYLKDEKKILDADSEEIREVLSFLENEFGIEKRNFERFCFYLKRDEVWILSEKIKNIKNPFDLRRGLRFARKIKGGYKITTNAVQIFGKLVKNKRVYLEDFESARDFLEGRDIKISSPYMGQVVVFYKDYVLGVGSLKNGILKSQVPRSRRIFEIKI